MGLRAASQDTQRGSHPRGSRWCCPALGGAPGHQAADPEPRGCPQRHPGPSSPPTPMAGVEPTYQDVEAGGLQQGDLVCDGQAGETWQAFGKLHDLNNALGGQFTEFVPEAQVQPDSMVGAGILQVEKMWSGLVVGSPAEGRGPNTTPTECADNSAPGSLGARGQGVGRALLVVDILA